jgi:hypothetical protein
MVPLPEVGNPISGTAFTFHFSFSCSVARSVTNLCPLSKIKKRFGAREAPFYDIKN